MKTLITGAAGFIGFHLALRLLENGEDLICIDNLNSYYDQNLKESRLNILKKVSKEKNLNFSFFKTNLEDKDEIHEIFKTFLPKIVINLAAQAGVRYSIENPNSYIQSNIVGFGNILELCKTFAIEHLIYASSSSVYGGNKKRPFSESHGVDHPVSIYAASKRANELMAHSYSHLFNLPTTGLRFFTVYGPWGRPDMALFLFTKAILSNQPIKVFNFGKMERAFTYIDDITESIVRLIEKKPSSNSNYDYLDLKPNSSWAPFKIFNIGSSKPTQLLDYINEIENNIGKKALKEFLPLQPGDVPATSTNCEELEKWIDYKPIVPVKQGVKNFIEWYLNYYNH
tara:strand:+ start:125 stop:1147 length:1023 start_codon:yes stop_codon:yes gene_type:complete